MKFIEVDKAERHAAQSIGIYFNESCCSKTGAGYRARTCGLDVGNVPLYQLS